MQTLADTQASLLAAIHKGGEPPAGLLAPAGLPPAIALSIHRGTCLATLGSALRISFPATSRLLGEAGFAELAGRFVVAELPVCGWLELYGSRFPGFLQTQAAVPGWIAEVAELDFCVNRALHLGSEEADRTGLRPLEDLASLADVVLPQVRLLAHPASSLRICSALAEHQWRSALQQGASLMPVGDVAEEPAYLLIGRTAYGVEVQHLPALTWHAARLLCGGTHLGAAHDYFGEQFSDLLGSLLGLHLFLGFTLE
ncbi:DNA-binding domain-containing protein [Chitinimonas sp.]|uniref:DNA-binding domain-containing protein n=1 Tax=Chitinimonas sp. TaxID=1934313 RepID=UPI002F94C355